MEEKKEEQKSKKINFKDIKEFLSDKKNKAIVKLIIYFIFFAIIIIYIRIINFKSNSYPVTDNIKEEEQLPKTITDKVSVLKDINNYAFKYNISVIDNNEEYNYIIEGKRYNDKYYFVINQNDIINEFYYDNDKLYLITGETKIEEDIENIIDLSIYKPNNIYNYLYNATYNYKQENASGDITINSNLSLSKFYELNNIIDDKEVTDNGNIILNTIENDNLVSIDIDITEFEKMQNENINKSIITISISNIDKIDYFDY